ncbi:MAG: hypothetical protein ACNA8H_00710 [Anaerolineales bacterium]
MLANKQTSIALLISTGLVFIYLLLAGAGGLGGPNMPGTNIFSLVFRYGLMIDAVGTIFLRSLLVFLGWF